MHLDWIDLIPNGQTINSKRYCEQLEDLKKVMLKKRPELKRNVVFHMNNARPHVTSAYRFFSINFVLLKGLLTNL